MGQDVLLAELYLNDYNVVDIDEIAPPTTTLQRYLSVRSVISTASSNAMKQQKAAEEEEFAPLEELGKGFCGVVFNIRGTGKVVKRAMGVKAYQLQEDFKSHLKAFETHKQMQCVLVPVPVRFIEAADCQAWLSDEGLSFANMVYREPACLLISERIHPLPQIIRKSLIEIFCPENIKEEALSSRENKSCLVRLYLGVNRPNLITSGGFTLRNFELTLDRMVHLGLDASSFADAMAESLATLHWAAKIDAFDVEYVLGSAPTETERDRTELRDIRRPPNFCRRTVRVWLLDFNQCQPITEDEEGVDKCVAAFYMNDPYYPRPSAQAESMETELWTTFVSKYLAMSHKIFNNPSPLPGLFITKVEQEAIKRRHDLAGPPKATYSPKTSHAKNAKTDKKSKKSRKYA
ncbi:zinc finger protein-domain-containing protein [Xylariaceae sp. AK1471]|nr:zinc finger protein-domain-containing protein [Xylariaceae sp. AK1471]